MLALGAERRDERAKHDEAGVGHQLGYLADAPDVLHPVRLGKAQVLVQSVPHIVAVQDDGVYAARVQRGFDEVRDGRFSRAWQTGEPQDRGAVMHEGRAHRFAYRVAVVVDIGRPSQRKIDHPGGDRFVGITIDQDEGAGITIVRIGVEYDRPGNGYITHAHLVQRQRLGGELRKCRDVDPMLDLGHRRRQRAVVDLHQVGTSGKQVLRRHPHQMRRELVGDLRAVTQRGKHVAARNIDFIGKRNGDRIAPLRGGKIAAGTDDPLDFGRLSGRKNCNFVTRFGAAACNRASKAAEIGIGPVDPLHRHAERLAGAVVLDVDRFEIAEQMRPGIPGRPFAARRNIVAVTRRHRNCLDSLKAERAGKDD